MRDFSYRLSFFNWFLGIWLIFSGIGYILFPELVQDQRFLLIKIFLIICGGALIFFGSNRLYNTVQERALYFLISIFSAFSIPILGKSGNQLIIATNIVLIIFLLFFLLKKLPDLTKIILLVDGWVIASGIVFYLWPDFTAFDPFSFWIKNNLGWFATIWILGMILLLIFSILSLKGNKNALLIFSYTIGITSLVLSILTSINGINDVAINSSILGTFAFSLPIWLYIEPLGLLTRLKLFNAFSWWLIIIIIGTGLSLYTKNSLRTFLNNNINDWTMNAAKSVESYFSERQLIMEGFRNNEELTRLISSKKKDQAALGNKLKELYLASRKFMRLVIADENGIIEATYPSDSSLLNKSIHEISSPLNISGAISNTSGKILGTILGVIDINDIKDNLNDFKYDEQTNIAVIDDKNNVLINSEPMLNLTKLGQGLVIKSSAPISVDNWKLTMEQPIHSLTQGDRTIASTVFLISIISAIGSLLIMLYSNRKITTE